MGSTVMFIAGLILLPAVGLATWAWFALVRGEEEFRSPAASRVAGSLRGQTVRQVQAVIVEAVSPPAPRARPRGQR